MEGESLFQELDFGLHGLDYALGTSRRQVRCRIGSNALMSMYCRIGSKLDAVKLFDEITEPDVVSCTVRIGLPFITATAEGPKHIETTLTRAKFEELFRPSL